MRTGTLFVLFIAENPKLELEASTWEAVNTYLLNEEINELQTVLRTYPSS